MVDKLIKCHRINRLKVKGCWRWSCWWSCGDNVEIRFLQIWWVSPLLTVDRMQTGENWDDFRLVSIRSELFLNYRARCQRHATLHNTSNPSERHSPAIWHASSTKLKENNRHFFLQCNGFHCNSHHSIYNRCLVITLPRTSYVVRVCLFWNHSR